MASAIRIPALRHHLTSFVCRHQQRRWAQVHDVRFLATQAPQLAVLEKYKEKLSNKARCEGHGSIEDMKKAYEDRIKAQKKKDAIDIPALPRELDPFADDAPTSESTGASPPVTASSTPSKAAPTPPKPTADTGKKPNAVKPLSEILDLEKASQLPEKELTAIWRLRHASSPQSLSAVIPAAAYAAMACSAQRYPQFVLPVPHESQGAEMHFLQWTFDEDGSGGGTSTVLFTQLAEFKNRGEFAQPHTTVTHHLDFAEGKGLVLMQGTVMEGRGVTPEHARWLVMCLQRFYGGWESGSASGEAKERAEERRKLLEWFGQGDQRFSVEKLLEEAERMG